MHQKLKDMMILITILEGKWNNIYDPWNCLNRVSFADAEGIAHAILFLSSNPIGHPVVKFEYLCELKEGFLSGWDKWLDYLGYDQLMIWNNSSKL